MSNSAACFPVTQEGGGHTVLNTITKVRLADGNEVGIVDWGYRDQYSTIDTLSGWTDQELRAFTYSDGDTISCSSSMTVQEQANLKHTNISSPAEMDSTEELLVYAIQVELYYLTEDTGTSAIVMSDAGQPVPPPQMIAALHASCILELEISQKAYFQASLGKFPPGFGVGGFAGGNATTVFGTNSVPSFEAVDMSPVPVHIGGTEKYAVIIHNPDGTAVTYRDASGNADADGVMRMRINLHGLHKRAAS